MVASVKRRIKRILSQVLTQLLLIILSVIFLFPFVWMVFTSLKSNEEFILSTGNFFQNLIPKDPLWENYVRIFREIPLLRYFGNTAVITVASVLGAMASSSLAAYAFARLRWPGREAFFWILLATMMLPANVTMIPNFIMYNTLGFNDTFVPLILPHFLGGGAFNIFLLKQFYRSIPKELGESARIDGCGDFSIWLRIILPLCKPILATVAIFTFMFSWNDFMGPLIYIKSTTKYTVALGLRAFQQRTETQWDMLMTGSVLSMIPTLILFIVCQKYFVEGIKLTGVKG